MFQQRLNLFTALVVDSCVYNTTINIHDHMVIWCEHAWHPWFSFLWGLSSRDGRYLFFLPILALQSSNNYSTHCSWELRELCSWSEHGADRFVLISMALYQHCSLHTFLSHLGISFSSGHGAGDPSLSPRLSLQVKIQRAKTYSSRDTGAAKGMPRGVRHHANIAPSTFFVFGPPLVLGTPCAPSSLLFGEVVWDAAKALMAC